MQHYYTKHLNCCPYEDSFSLSDKNSTRCSLTQMLVT
uniref:Uncharacterized protein n=1 Tax=Anguilla anguilla TaxID=7936 RepID=A0A0E9V134_ANGAN